MTNIQFTTRLARDFRLAERNELHQERDRERQRRRARRAAKAARKRNR